jgi:hypothetical protein
MQHTLKSWFPPHEVWSSVVASGQCWLEWTSGNERWFKDHMERIHAGTVQPMTAHEWRDKLRIAAKAMSITKKIVVRNEQLSHEFLQRNLAA